MRNTGDGGIELVSDCDSGVDGEELVGDENGVTMRGWGVRCGGKRTGPCISGQLGGTSGRG